MGSQGWGCFSITLKGRHREDPVNKITWGYPMPAEDAAETETAQHLLKQRPPAPVFAASWMWLQPLWGRRTQAISPG